jgi:RNA polymerase sigma-70 factor (ECF subfamily)
MGSANNSISHSGFENTRWSLVAALDNRDKASLTPLLELCLRNWYPVYAYLRHCGHSPETAQAMTQAFFDHLLDRGSGRADGERFGRFREFLLSELHAFLQSDRPPLSEHAPKPPLDIESLEARQRQDSVHGGSPEQALRRGFALGIIGEALKRLRAEARDARRLPMFEKLERYLTTEPRPGEFESVADAMNARPLFVVMAVKRLRQRFTELIDEELGDTVLSPEQLLAERTALYEAMARNGGE